MRLIIFIFLTTLINVNLSAQEATKEHKDSINTVIAKRSEERRVGKESKYRKKG